MVYHSLIDLQEMEEAMKEKDSAYFCLLIGYIGLIIVSLIAIRLYR